MGFSFRSCSGEFAFKCSKEEWVSGQDLNGMLPARSFNGFFLIFWS